MSFLPVNYYYKDILKIAIPAVAGLSTQMVVSLVDAAMVGRLENPKFALAAMGVGVLATWAIVSFFSSLASGTHLIVARRFGEKKYKECGETLINSLYMALLIGTIIVLFGVFLSTTVGHFFAKDPKVGDLASEYIFFRLLGIPFFLMTVSYRGFFFGLGNTKIFMISGILTNIFNIIFNYGFIYGNFGLPKMGLAGAGIGSSLATLCDAIFYLIVSLNANFRVKFSLYQNLKIIPQILKSIYKIALPISFQNVFILVGFLSFISVTGLIGVAEQAATQAIISLLFLSFLPCYGFGIAVQTLVGTSVGKGKKLLAKIYGLETAKIATYYTVSLALLFIFIPHWMLNLITTDQSIIDIAIPAMRIAGFAQVFYATGVVLANGLQAIGKSAFVMRAEIFANLALFVPLSYLFGVVWGFGLEGAWLALPVYIIIYAAIILIKFKYGKWKSLMKI
ncbi:MAG: MATE family efflux transporter [Chlorobiaceae bacterium]|nr:MATE family efflux transporter [Chlorobiaceae bacterium]MBA4310263.1 MATE family efflux transporter [Chlorobiaceae bacterium]